MTRCHQPEREWKTCGLTLSQSAWACHSGFFFSASKQSVPLTQKPFLCLPPVFSQAHRLTPDFPEALFDLLCTFQEGRRLNDQRCSFRLESGVRRRRCHSEPNASKPINRGESSASPRQRRGNVSVTTTTGSMKPAVLPDSGMLSIKHAFFRDHTELPALCSLLSHCSRLFLHDFTAERGVFRPGGHCARTAAG